VALVGIPVKALACIPIKLTQKRNQLNMAALDRQRFDIHMPKELADQLDSISDSTGLTRPEIFRRAVALYKEAKNIEKNNGKVLFKDAQGETSHVVGL
jgi:hypothetical protein